MAESTTVVTDPNLLAFFRELVRRAISHQQVELSEHSEFYVVNLLTELKKSEKFFDTHAGNLDETPLALLLDRAVHGDSPTRIRSLKFLGDTALFVAGIFPERATRHFKTLDYYIRMGGGAYLTLATTLPGQKSFGEVFEEMGLKFKSLVEILQEVGAAGRDASNSNLLEYYERFLATGDARLREILVKEGILPIGKVIGEQ